MRSRNVGHRNLRSLQSLSLVLPHLVQGEGAEAEGYGIQTRGKQVKDWAGFVFVYGLFMLAAIAATGIWYLSTGKR